MTALPGSLSVSGLFPELTRDEVYRVETPRLWLRWPRREDAGVMRLTRTVPETAAPITVANPAMTPAEVEERIAEIRDSNREGRCIGFVLSHKGLGHRPVGVAAVHTQPGGRIELGYRLDPSFWGQGLMGEAVRALCAQAFDLSLAAKIDATVRACNTRSIRVLVGQGFVLAGSHELETESYGRYAVHTYALARPRPSRLLAAQLRQRGLPRYALAAS